MKFLYKYPQRRYPYEELVTENQQRSRDVSEYEIMDSDAFDDDRYWDVFVEVCSFLDLLICLPDEYFSTQKMKRIQTIFTFASRATIVVRTQQLSILSRSSGSRTLGLGLLKSLPCLPSRHPFDMI